MRRQLWLILIGLSVGVGLVSLLSFDAGYVLVQFGKYRIESTVAASAVALLLLALTLFVVVRLISTIFGMGPGIGRWFEKRKEERGVALLQDTLLDMFHERTVAVSQRLPKLHKAKLLMASDKLATEAWVLIRQLKAAERQNQLKRIWREADVSLKDDGQVMVVYTDKLLQLGLAVEAEASLQGLAKSSWNASATAVLSKLNLQDPPAMVNSLVALSKKEQATDVELGLVIAKAQLLPKNEAQTVLTERYNKSPSAHLLTALGTTSLRND